MVEKLYSRLNFINIKFKKEFQRLAAEGPKRIAPSKLNEDEVKQDHDDNPDFGPTVDKSKQSNGNEDEMRPETNNQHEPKSRQESKD
jgi:hypothetical protein